MSEPNLKDPFVSFLCGLDADKDRGIFAALRSGLGKSPGEASRMFPYVAKFLRSSDPTNASVIAVFLTGALYAKHPNQKDDITLGRALKNSVKTLDNPEGKHGENGVEARLVACLDAHYEDMQPHIEGLISLCQSANQGLDWYRFRWDLQALVDDNEGRRDRVRMAWAKDFWQHNPTAAQTNQTGKPNL